MEKTQPNRTKEYRGQQLLTTGQAAKYLGVAHERIREWQHLKVNPLPYVQLPNCKFPYFRKSDLDAFIESFLVKGSK